MDKLNRIRADIHNEVNKLRNIKYMVEQESFGNLWIMSDPEQRAVVMVALEKRDKLRLINWIRKHPSIELGEMGVAQLKEIAQELKIKNWSRMLKTELLISINKQRDRIDEDKDIKLSVKEMIFEINDFNGQMEPLLIEAGVTDEYLVLSDGVEYIDSKYLTDGYEWISIIYNTVWRNAHNIKRLLSDEMWARYEAWEDFEDAREVVLLREALTNLKKQVVNTSRPVLFKKSRIKLIAQRAKNRRKRHG
jgi:hypothetical protein